MNEYEEKALRDRACCFCFFWQKDCYCHRFGKDTTKVTECTEENKKKYFVDDEIIRRAALAIAMELSGKDLVRHECQVEIYR